MKDNRTCLQKKKISFSFFKINEYRYIKRIKDNLSKNFDKYDYNFKYDSLFQTYIISHIY